MRIFPYRAQKQIKMDWCKSVPSLTPAPSHACLKRIFCRRACFPRIFLRTSADFFDAYKSPVYLCTGKFKIPASSDPSSQKKNCRFCFFHLFRNLTRFIGNKFPSDFYKRKTIFRQRGQICHCTGNTQIIHFPFFPRFCIIFCPSFYGFHLFKVHRLNYFIHKIDSLS